VSGDAQKHKTAAAVKENSFLLPRPQQKSIKALMDSGIWGNPPFQISIISVNHL